MSNAAPRNRRRKASDDVIRISDRNFAEEVEVDDGVDLPQLWATVRERSGFVIGVGVLLFLGVMASTLTSSMTFRSSGRLYLGELEMRARTATGNAGQVDISGAAQGDIGSEIEILKSQSLVTKAILDSGLNVSITPVGWRPPRFWQWLLAKRKPQILDVPAREIRVVETALQDDALGSRSFDVYFDTSNDYRVLTVDNVELGHGELRKPTQLEGLSGLTLLAGNEGAPMPGARFRLTVDPLDAVTDGVLGSLTVTAPNSPAAGGDGAKVVMLEFTHSSPNAAATFLRELMRGYLGERQTWKTEDASAAETFVGEQLQSLRRALDATQKQLADYRSNQKVVVNENGASALVEQLGRYEEQRVQARLQVAALQDMRRALKQPNPPTEAFLFGETQDSVLEGLSRSLASARQEFDTVAKQYGAESPQAQQMHAKVDAQIEQIRNYVNSRLARAQESLAELDRIINQFDGKLRSVPGAEFGLAQLGRESEVYSRVYSYMLERQQQAAIIKASTVSKNRILDYPKVPYREDAPKLAMRAASLLLGLLLGALMVILHRLFASSFQSEAEVRRTAGSVPIFATVPRREEGLGRPNDRRVDPFREPFNPAYAEAFRTLRTNLYFDVQSDVGKVILITSPVPGDGKTSSAFALASILAADERRVCVIDADLRKPSHFEFVRKAHLNGLREILAGQVRWADVVTPVELSVGRFDSIGAGQKGPAELLSGERMNRFLTELRSKYDYVILDCASFPVVADPLALASLSDCVLSVFRLRNTPQKLANEHVRRLASAASNYGIIIHDPTQLGAVYPARPKPPLGARLRTRLAELASGRTQTSTSTWLLAVAAGLVLAGGAAVVSRSRLAPPREIAPLPPAAAPAAPATVQPATDLIVDPSKASAPPPAAPVVPATAAPEPAAAKIVPTAVVPDTSKRARVIAPAKPMVPSSARPFAREEPAPAAATPAVEIPINPY